MPTIYLDGHREGSVFVEVPTYPREWHVPVHTRRSFLVAPPESITKLGTAAEEVFRITDEYYQGARAYVLVDVP